MKILKKIRLNVLVAFAAVFVLAVSWIAGIPFKSASADDSVPTDVVYIDTNVEDIGFAKHSTYIFLGFRLTESDYNDFGAFEGDFAGKDAYTTYEKYIAVWLTYWKNFADMNSEGAKFDQLYTYWDGSSVGSALVDTVTHRSTLKLLEFGFVIAIPAGTTFPSATYLKGNCEGAPIMYRTTENCAFYFDGNDFKPMDYAIAQARDNANKSLDSINGKLYYEEQRAQIATLVAATKAELKKSVTLAAVQETMASFQAEFDKIMSIADFETLAVMKTEAKANLKVFFDSLLKDAYDSENWAQIESMQTEGVAVIDSIKTFEDLDEAVKAIKFTVSKVPVLDEVEAFKNARVAALEKIGNAFDETLYREAERAEGAALVQAGKLAVENASDYMQVVGISAEYIAKIGALKTDAQWKEEENAVVEDEEVQAPSTESDNTNNVVILPGEAETETKKVIGCKSVAGSIGIIFGVTLMAASLTIKNKKVGKKDEK